MQYAQKKTPLWGLALCIEMMSNIALYLGIVTKFSERSEMVLKALTLICICGKISMW